MTKKDSVKKVSKEKSAEKSLGEKEKIEQIGYHKGCLATLSKERQELVRIVGIVEQLIQLHLGALKDSGVNLEDLQKENVVSPEKEVVKKKKPIEDIL